ncbi:MAG: glycosyltransferase [Alphaproteobacteria bacterium]|nr:glycosyltransferase [Alphaproteobacteria bacterium]
MKPDVSVIIATYNVEAYIEAAIQSALAQTDVMVEVIAVDDCSTDNTWQIISQHPDDRVKAYRLPQNGGPSAARNHAISHAEATWIAVLDGDDTMAPDRLSLCLARAQAMQAQMVVDNLLEMHENNGKLTQGNPMYRLDTLGNTLSLEEFIAGNSAFLGGESLGYLKPIIQRGFLATHQLSYDPEIRIGEDYLLLASVLAEGAICAIEPKAGYNYTIREGSISHRLTLADIERIEACDEKFLRKYPLDTAAQNAQYRRSKKLKEAKAFTMLVHGIKHKQPANILGALRISPAALIYLNAPIVKRIRQCFLGGRRGNG